MNAQFCNIVRPIGGPGNLLCNAQLTAAGGTIENATVQEVHQTVDSYAAYAQANIHFTDQFFATVGGRFSKDEKEGTYDQFTNQYVPDPDPRSRASDAAGHQRQQVHLSPRTQL